MKILLRHYGSLGDNGSRKEYVDLPGVPVAGDEIHWAERIVLIDKVIWFPGPNEHGPLACLNVREI